MIQDKQKHVIKTDSQAVPAYIIRENRAFKNDWRQADAAELQRSGVLRASKFLFRARLEAARSLATVQLLASCAEPWFCSGSLAGQRKKQGSC